MRFFNHGAINTDIFLIESILNLVNSPDICMANSRNYDRSSWWLYGWIMIPWTYILISPHKPSPIWAKVIVYIVIHLDRTARPDRLLQAIRFEVGPGSPPFLVLYIWPIRTSYHKSVGPTFYSYWYYTYCSWIGFGPSSWDIICDFPVSEDSREDWCDSKLQGMQLQCILIQLCLFGGSVDHEQLKMVTPYM